MWEEHSREDTPAQHVGGRVEHGGSTLALFDIDGTLTTDDTMFAFARFVVGAPKLWLGMLALAPLLLAARLGLMDAGMVKGWLLMLLFASRDKTVLERAARQFCNDVLPKLLRPEGLATLRRHRDAGDRVLLVSASLDLWVQPFADAEGIPLLATPTAWSAGRFMGLGGANNKGPEKVRRIRAVVDPADFSRVVAYGDSSGDREMLAMANEPHYKPFRGR